MHDLLWATLRIALIGAVVSVVGGVFATVGTLINLTDEYGIAEVAFAANTTISIFGAILIFRLLSEALRLWK